MSFGLIYTFTVSWEVGIFLLVIIPLFFLINKKFATLVGEGFRSYQECEDINKNFYDEIFSNITIIRVFQLEKNILIRNKNNFDNKFTATKHRARATSGMYSITESGIILVELVILTIGMILIQNGNMRVGSLIGIWNAGIGSVIYPITELPNIFSKITEQIVSWDRLGVILDREAEIEEKCDECKHSRILALCVEHVSYKYSKDHEVNCLRDITFQCKKHEIVCITGESGAGKSTLIKLILGLLIPLDGKIYINCEKGILSEAEIRQSIAYVPQDKALFHMSIFDNIAFGLDHVSERDVDAVATQVGLSEYINSLPQGYKTVIGSNFNLSIGQAQRICIARALLRKVPFIICDEPFSSLDASTRDEMLNLINALTVNVGFIIVSHDRQTLSIATKNIKIVGGVSYEV